MRKHLLLFLTALFSLTLAAEKYTIVFNSSNADSSSPTTALSSIVLSATANCVEDIRYADKIVVLDDGNVAGIGSHDELMKDCDVYKEIYNSQNQSNDAPAANGKAGDR